jgi:hypothetical protein
MSERIWIVYCPDEGFERHATREAAEIAAHKALDYFCGDGWPEDIEDLAVYEARPVLAAREVAGSRREIVDCRDLNCVGREIEHPDGSVSECPACEGTGRVYDDGEAAHVDSDWDHVVNFELVEEPPAASATADAPKVHEPALNDARATVRTAILSALATTCHLTGLRSGDAADALVAEILRELEAVTTRASLAQLATQAERSPR